jgi:hypothetical protein
MKRKERTRMRQNWLFFLGCGSLMLALGSMTLVEGLTSPPSVAFRWNTCLRGQVNPNGEQQEVLRVISSAQEAMESPTKAKSIRQDRSKRGGRLLETSQLFAASKKKISNDNNDKAQAAKNARRQKGNYLPYNVTMNALLAYHAQHGDLAMPRRYVVPELEAYPSEFHGLDLSSTVYNMNWWQDHVKQRPERVAALNKLGFVWQRLQPEWNTVLEALITYSSISGHVLVPNKFVVPHGERDWPMATWGIPLGNCVCRMRTRNDFLRGANAAARRDQLDGLGFVWDVQEHRFHKFYEALRIFAQLRSVGASGQLVRDRIPPLQVPSYFVVPESPDWPPELWGFPLGAKCTAVRQKEVYIKGKPERQIMLDELGFHWSGNADLGWLKVVHAAAIYSKLHQRQLNVPYQFVVPARLADDGKDWPWPEYLWGLPLGQRLRDVRTKGAYLHGELGGKRRRQLDALGFNWKPLRGRPRASNLPSPTT